MHVNTVGMFRRIPVGTGFAGSSKAWPVMIPSGRLKGRASSRSKGCPPWTNTFQPRFVAGKRVNAVHYLDPDNEKAALAISKVCGIINDFKRVASEAKRRKGDEPAPEPNGGASVS